MSKIITLTYLYLNIQSLCVFFDIKTTQKIWLTYKTLLRMSYLHFDNKYLEKFDPGVGIHFFTNLKLKTLCIPNKKSTLVKSYTG